MAVSDTDRMIDEAVTRDRARDRREVSVSTVSSHLVSVVAEAAMAAGADRQQITRILGGDPALLADSGTRIPTVTIARLWDLLREFAGPEAGVLAAEHAERGRLYVWDYLIALAPTLAEGLRDAARFNSTMCDPRVALTVVEDGSLLTASYFDLPHREPVDALSREFAVAVTLRRAREGFGAAAVPVRVDFSHRAPVDRGYLTRALGTANVHFGQGRDAITFIGTGSATTAQANDPVLQQILRAHARHLQESIGPEPAWPAAFRAVLRASMPEHGGDGIRLDEVARRLRLSERTVQRRLAEYGTTWSAEVELVRRDTAIGLLRERDRSIQSIALQLGYRDRRVLARAFRRWTGQSPAAFRRALANTDGEGE
ncbi:AraC family transcriptional regulator ligand-binding domain-containing protein [Nocardia sp. NBC_00511]|uniref:AraC family transcriptional regulator ligand-binding domain-containing protein n=1 Tax=Nocardia sp. NBC_00511 TaxID=2903591 RepID=UPI0030E31575